MNMPTLERTQAQLTDYSIKPFFIGGAWHATEHILTSHSLATGDVLGHVCAGGAGEIDLAVQAAQKAFPAWRNADEAERKAVLQRLHDVLAERRRESTNLTSRESGVKQSGIGWTHGRWGLQAVSDIKVIATSKHTSRLWWFPYQARTHKLIEIAVALQHLRGWRGKVRTVALTLFAGR